MTRQGQGLDLNPDLTPKTVSFNDCSIYFPEDKSGKFPNHPQFIGNIQIPNRRHAGCREIWTTVCYFSISDITSLVFPEAVTAHRYQISQLFSLPKYLLNLRSFLLFDKSWSRPLAKLLLYLLLPLKQVKVESKWVSREKNRTYLEILFKDQSNFIYLIVYLGLRKSVLEEKKSFRGKQCIWIQVFTVDFLKLKYSWFTVLC